LCCCGELFVGSDFIEERRKGFAAFGAARFGVFLGGEEELSGPVVVAAGLG
jgi:hypothetical protein